MSTLSISIAGRDYDVACDNGQEAHLKTLAKSLDMRVKTLATSMTKPSKPKPGEAQLLLLTSLMLVDELEDAQATLKQLRHDITHSSQSFEKNKQIELETAISATITDIAERIEAIAGQLERV